MERTMTIKKFFAPTSCLRQLRFRDVWQRLSMVLMLVMLTTVTAWADEAPVASGYCGRPEVNEGKNLVWELEKNGSNERGDTYTVTIQVNPNANEIEGDNFDMADFDDNPSSDDYVLSLAQWVKASTIEPFPLITKVTIGEGVTSIGNSAFAFCVFLTEVNIPSTIRHIGKWAFSTCTHLSSITLPDGLESIGVRAFLNCRNLMHITIPASVTTIERTAFADAGLRTVWMEGITPPTIYDTEDEYGAFQCVTLEAISVPFEAFDAYRDGEGWSTYLDKVFPRGYCGKDDATTTDVDESKNLKWHVRKCDNQIKVVIEKSADATGSCDMADYDDVDNKAPWLSALGAEAFAGNTIVAVEDGVTSIGAYAFAGFGPTTAFIGNDVTAIGSHAFDGTGLTELTIKNTTPPTLGTDVFKDCTAIDKVSVPTGTQVAYLETEGWGTLIDMMGGYCGDPSVNEGKNVVWSIVKSEGKATLVIEKSATATGSCNMADYASYQNTVDNVAPWIDARYGKEDETDEYEPEHYFTRGFKYDIESVTIGEGVTAIGNHAFDGTGLTGITMPASVTLIGDEAFANNSAFTTLTMKPTTPPTLGNDVFKNTDLSTIIVPKEAIDTYKGQWENSVNVNYADIVSAGYSELPLGVKMLIDGEYGDKTRSMIVELYLKKPDNLPDGSVVTYRIEGGMDYTENNQDSDGLRIKLCDQIDATQASELTSLPQWNDYIVGFGREAFQGVQNEYGKVGDFAVIKGQLSEGQTIRVTGIFGPLKRRADGTQTREIYSTTGVLANMEYYVLQEYNEFNDYGKDYTNGWGLELCRYKYIPTAYLYPNDFIGAATQPDPRVSSDGVSKTVDALESDIHTPFDVNGEIYAGTLMVHENIGNSDPLTIVIVEKYDAVDAPEGYTSATGNGTDANTRTVSVTLQQHYSSDYEGLQDEFTYRIVARPLCRDEIEGDNKISDATLRDMTPPSPKDGDNNDITLTADADGNYVGTFTLKQDASITLNFTIPVWVSETAGRRHFFYRIEPADPKPKGAYYIDTQREGDKLGANVYTFEVFVKLGTTSTEKAYVWSAVHNNRENGALVTTPVWKVVSTPILFAKNATHTWSTFCAKDNYQLPEGCTAYTLKSVANGTLTVSPLMNGETVATTVPAYVPVMIHRSSTGATTAAIQAELYGVINIADEWTNDNGWVISLTGSDYDSYYKDDGYFGYDSFSYYIVKGYSLGNVVAGMLNDNPCNHYLYGNPGTVNSSVTGLVQVGNDNKTWYALYGDTFLRIDTDNGIPTNRCVLCVENSVLTRLDGQGSSNARQLAIVINDGEGTTGIASITPSLRNSLDRRNLSGQRVGQGYKGLVIVNGKKMIVR